MQSRNEELISLANQVLQSSDPFRNGYRLAAIDALCREKAATSNVKDQAELGDLVERLRNVQPTLDYPGLGTF